MIVALSALLVPTGKDTRSIVLHFKHPPRFLHRTIAQNIMFRWRTGRPALHLHIHGKTIDISKLTPEKYKRYSYTEEDVEQVFKMVSSPEFEEWAQQQTYNPTDALIRDSSRWSPKVLCKNMNWDSKLLSSRCGPGELTVGEIILPTLYKRMAKMWQQTRKIDLHRNPYSVPGWEGMLRPLQVEHTHIIHNGCVFNHPSSAIENHPTKRFLLYLPDYVWNRWLYNGTWKTRFIFFSLLLSLFLKPKWYKTLFVFIWQQVLCLIVWPLLQTFISRLQEYGTPLAVRPPVSPDVGTSAVSLDPNPRASPSDIKPPAPPTSTVQLFLSMSSPWLQIPNS